MTSASDRQLRLSLEKGKDALVYSYLGCTMSRISGRGALAVLMTVAGLGLSQQANAATLNFDGAGCGVGGNSACSNNELISQDYGDTAQIDITYGNTNASSVQFWANGYGSLDNVIFAGGSGAGSGTITFTPNAGFEVSLRSFRTANYNNVNRFLSYSVSAGGGFITSDTIAPSASASTDIIVNSAYFTSSIVLSWGPDSYYNGLDDITFDVRAVDTMAVPGPIAGAGLPALLALGGFVAWRRRKAAATA
jgi:LPXTG-motif cell wall-anchored protein